MNLKLLISEIKIEIKDQNTRWNCGNNNQKLISQGAREALEWVLKILNKTEEEMRK